jgi:putative NADH-flavin reductase
MIGGRILNELLARGHNVTAVVRDPSKLADSHASIKKGDVLSSASVEETAAGADAVISAYAAPFTETGKLLDATRSLIVGLRQAGVKRFLMVGGASSLKVAPGVELIDAPNFPAEWKPIAQAHRDALDVLKSASDLEWTSLSPAALIQPGERTGKFRLGLNDLISDAAGESRISAEDYAIAMVDELDNPKHVRQRFTVGY